MNIRKTVRGFASVDVADVTIKDQLFLKRCTFVAGAGFRVASHDASLAKAKKAIAAREEGRKVDGKDIISD